MATNFRRSKKVGPFRVTASKSGIGVSAGAGPVRVSRSPKGRVTRTVRAPGTGIYSTKVVNSGGGTPRPGRIPGEVGPGMGANGAGASKAGGAHPPGGKNEARNGCLGCAGLLVLALLIFAGISSCTGGSRSPSSSSAPAPLVSAPTSAEVATSDAPSTATTESPWEAPTSSDATSSDPYVPPAESETTSEYVPPAATDVPEEASTSTGVPTACYPLTSRGRCYHIHEFCRNRDIGSSGIDVNGTPMTCVQDGKRGRWS